MTLHDDAVGYAACFVAVLFFGSNFVPVKRVATADGMFFSLIMTSAVLLEGFVVQLWRGNPKFEPFAMLGGVIWYVGFDEYARNVDTVQTHVRLIFRV